MNRFEKYFYTNKHGLDGRESYNTYDFFPADTEERFNEHVEKYPDSIHIQNYLKKPIQYDLNMYGFRTPDDFDLKDSGNVFLGCSHTFGIGHYLENTWSYILSQKIGGKFYNISHPGTGVMTQYRFLKHFSPEINFKNVFHFLPHECWQRMEYPFKEGAFDILSYHEEHEEHFQKYKDFILDVITVEKFSNNNVMVYIDAIKTICKENGANYYLITDSYLKEINPYHTEMTPARDLSHYYVEEHHELANLFLKQYNNNLKQ